MQIVIFSDFPILCLSDIKRNEDGLISQAYVVNGDYTLKVRDDILQCCRGNAVITEWPSNQKPLYIFDVPAGFGDNYNAAIEHVLLNNEIDINDKRLCISVIKDYKASRSIQAEGTGASTPPADQ